VAQVILPRSLAALVPGVERRATVAGSTVGELIAALDGRWPGVADRLCDAGPSIRAHINVFVDGERATTLDQPVGPDATVHVIPAIAGGSGRTRHVRGMSKSSPAQDAV
jgi:molybdopterin converting factor small subunit